jgi:hypothetical protein
MIRRPDPHPVDLVGDSLKSRRLHGGRPAWPAHLSARGGGLG